MFFHLIFSAVIALVKAKKKTTKKQQYIYIGFDLFGCFLHRIADSCLAVAMV